MYTHTYMYIYMDSIYLIQILVNTQLNESLLEREFLLCERKIIDRRINGFLLHTIMYCNILLCI